MKRIKVLIGMKQGQFLFNAEGGYEHINGFPYRDAFFMQQVDMQSY